MMHRRAQRFPCDDRVGANLSQEVGLFVGQVIHLFLGAETIRVHDGVVRRGDLQARAEESEAPALFRASSLHALSVATPSAPG